MFYDSSDIETTYIETRIKYDIAMPIVYTDNEPSAYLSIFIGLDDTYR
jgi:hypothetical protein